MAPVQDPLVASSASSAVEPIPLRSLTVLINYERMISDPRYKGLKLGGSTRGDPNMSEGIKGLLPQIWDSEPESVTRRTVHLWAADTETETEAEVEISAVANPPAISAIHPYASAGVKGLSLAERDLIFHETRAQNGCYNATGMYQEFFALCPEGQQVSIQIGNEPPLLVDATSRMVFEYTLHLPKHDIRSVIPISSAYPNPDPDPNIDPDDPSERITYTTSGGNPSENHCVMAFLPAPYSHPPKSSSQPPKENYILVDMTRLQYGDAGRGTYGESYFLGPYDAYLESMREICGEVRFSRMIRSTTGRVNEPENQIRVKECARRAWERWGRRELEGWCEYCGRGGGGELILKMCKGCRGRKVWYCGEEHNKKGWKLHKLTCESVVNKKPVFGPARKEDA